MSRPHLRALRGIATAAALAGSLLAAAVPSSAAAAPAPASTSAQSTAAAAAANPMLFGVSAASRREVETHERALGRKMGAVHYYRKWDGNLFGPDHLWMRDNGRTLFLAIRSQRNNGAVIPWRQVAAAKPGNALHSDMLKHAAAIKAFKAKVYITFNHEPDAHEAAAMGTPAEYVAAWRNVISTYRAAGATNAEFVFNVTAYGFARKDAKNAKYYYPGDGYVDHIASDAYNWYGCRPGQGWRPLADVIEAQRQFGRAHPTKGLMIMEFGSGEDPAKPGRKGDWLREAGALFQKPGYEQFNTFVYWPGRNFKTSGPGGCFDYLTSPSATQGLRDLANMPANMATAVR